MTIHRMTGQPTDHNHEFEKIGTILYTIGRKRCRRRINITDVEQQREPLDLNVTSTSRDALGLLRVTST
jgi:hypothetical protein